MSRIDAIGAYTKWTPFGAGAGAIEAFAVGLWGEAGLLTLLAFVYVACRSLTRSLSTERL